MKKFCLDFFLFIVAYLLLLPLTLINFIAVLLKRRNHVKGYFRSTAVNIDKFGNREFRTLWNITLITDNGYQFGNLNETISSALGKNERDGTLSKIGKALVWILNTIDENHCKNSIIEFQNERIYSILS
ncbi:hypothetical protein OK18_19030 [Chryseobacterium gallinarum]|uniref:Uncharacterized protein n=1 Tax=Chryseobacterium gallinarum TaxID=1324352 RepID=A0A0G3M5H3_CHRGL|nr:hypothetical protein [Chryseobacterium gallinarum]AKK74426.1 hypothetical protein OK18_19030 [Chryseobacterium gallinarum]